MRVAILGHMQRILALLVLVGLAVLVACSGASQPTNPTAAPAAKPTAAPAAAIASPSSSPAVAAASTSPSPAAAAASSSPSPATATALPPPTVPSPTPASPATPTPGAATTTVWVADTDGGGVYLRNSPHDGDRADVLPEGTPLVVTGAEQEGDGQRWYPVRTADGTEGFVPVIYTSMTEPQEPPAPPQGEPK
jgi:cytoskeletal protein RodZ